MREPAPVAAAPKAPARAAAERVLLAACLIVAVAAAIAGVLMLIVPGDTEDFFAWALAPSPLAAIVGGLYVASAVVFGTAAGTRWPAGRGLCVGALALTVPTLAPTIAHRDVFDFSRALAVIWVILFVASPLTFAAILVALRREGGPPAPCRPGRCKPASPSSRSPTWPGRSPSSPIRGPSPPRSTCPCWAAGSWAPGACSWRSWPPGRPCAAAARPGSPCWPWSPSPPARSSVPSRASAKWRPAPLERPWIAVLATLTVTGGAAFALARPAGEPLDQEP